MGQNQTTVKKEEQSSESEAEEESSKIVDCPQSSSVPSSSLNRRQIDPSNNEIQSFNQTPVLVPKIEKPDSSKKTTAIPRDPRQRHPNELIETSAEDEKLLRTKPKTNQKVEAPVVHHSEIVIKTEPPGFQSDIVIKTEKICEEEASGISDWKDEWLSENLKGSAAIRPVKSEPSRFVVEKCLPSTAVLPQQPPEAAKLLQQSPKAPEPEVDDGNESSDSTSTVGLPSPKRLSPARDSMANDESSDSDEETPLVQKAASFFSPSVDLFAKKESKALPKAVTKFSSYDPDEDSENTADLIIPKKTVPDNSQSDDTDSEENLFDLPKLSSQALIEREHKNTSAETVRGKGKRPLAIEPSTPPSTSSKKARFVFEKNPQPSTSKQSVPVAASSSETENVSTPNNDISCPEDADPPTPTSAKRENGLMKVKYTAKSRGDKMLEDYLNPVPPRRKRPVTPSKWNSRRKKRVHGSPSRSGASGAESTDFETDGQTEGEESLAVAIPISRDPRLRNRADPRAPRQTDPLPDPQQSLRTSILKRVLKWHFNWIEEQKQLSEAPPILKGVKNIIPELTCTPLMSRYYDLQAYYNAFHPLMIHEMWAKLSKEYLEEHKYQPIIWEISVKSKNEKAEADCAFIECVLLAADESEAPHLNDLVHFYLTREGRDFFAFGFVEKITVVKKLRPGDFDMRLMPKSKRASISVEIILRVWKNYSQTFQIKTIYKMTKVASLDTAMMLFRTQVDLTVSPLRDVILSPKEPAFELVRYSKMMKENLNQHQFEAVFSIAQSILMTPKDEPKVGLLQGMPGTGKSHVIVCMVEHILSHRPANNRLPRVLVCAPSDSAVDELVRRLLTLRQNIQIREDRFNILRIGGGMNMHRSVKEVTVEDFFMRSKHTIKEEKTAKSDIQKLQEESNILELKKLDLLKELDSPDSARNADQQKDLSRRLREADEELEAIRLLLVEAHTKLKEKVAAEEQELKYRIIDTRGDVICTTLTACNDSNMQEFFRKKMHFDGKEHRPFLCCIIDDASQCTEPETLIPLSFGMNKVVLVGDSEQKPTSVVSNEAKQFRLDQSLFDRLCTFVNSIPSEFRNQLLTLKDQYRMNSEICGWPSKYYYANELTTATSLYRPTLLHAYRIMDVTDSEETREGRSIVNHAEALFIVKLLEGIFTSPDMEKRSIGVITFSRKQCDLIRFKLKERCPKDYRRVAFNTVGGFYGAEKDVMIMSCVRSKKATSGEDLKAIADELNVATTRARDSFIICGQLRCLLSNETLKDMILDADKRQVIHRVSSVLDVSIINMLIVKSLNCTFAV